MQYIWLLCKRKKIICHQQCQDVIVEKALTRVSRCSRLNMFNMSPSTDEYSMHITILALLSTSQFSLWYWKLRIFDFNHISGRAPPVPQTTNTQPRVITGSVIIPTTISVSSFVHFLVCAFFSFFFLVFVLVHTHSRFDFHWRDFVNKDRT